MNPHKSEQIPIPHEHSLMVTISLGLGAVLLAICVVQNPGAAFEAALQGLTLWWRIVFPGLLPFLMLSQMLIAYGFVHALGQMLNPFFRKLLGIPGSAAWLIPLGLTAGFPAGAEAAAQLYKKNQLSARDAERLAALSHFCNPMLLIVVIGTGFLHRPALGLLLASIHVLSGLIAGMAFHLLMQMQRKKTSLSSSQAEIASDRHVSWLRSTSSRMNEARLLDGRSFGKLLGDTVTTSVQTLMMVGGYMLIFAVILRMAGQFLPDTIASYILPGLVEIHLGAYAVAESAISSPAFQAALLSAILGWSGLCAYLQVQAVMISAGLRIQGFILMRLLHAITAFGLTFLLWIPLVRIFPEALPTYLANGMSMAGYNSAAILPGWKQALFLWPWQSIILTITIASLILFSLIWKKQQSKL
ncbi:sporulation integral membrane protein YlbJ [Paenibacillus shirakamiensis]|uniref:Sporulation integral membrane protein YlbJ n=1 Tax=Paenibacillus shirakamiensis TaxID=1265935 RepID=A0ABS4JHG6_9BACL|nr:nucleoside recognition domain-containing protein [Paenibacillus shirakamiensis]MBP2001170.1 sporulation integral membrane protein YlbJ [Paenibacillus shirakamiensis]